MNELARAHHAAVQMVDTSSVRVHQHGACILGTEDNQCAGHEVG